MNKPTIPPTKDIPRLTGKSDWGPWNLAIINLITNQQVYSHISDGLDDGATYDPLFIPTYPPVIHPASNQQEHDEFTAWWAQDGIASHILLSRLADPVLYSIPNANPHLGQCHSARDIYNSLHQTYGLGDYNSAMSLENKLRVLTANPSKDLLDLGNLTT